MKKYELSEEELEALIGLAAAITCDDEEFKENEALVMNAAAVIAFKIENHLNGTAPFPKEEIEYIRKIVATGESASSLLRTILGGI